MTTLLPTQQQHFHQSNQALLLASEMTGLAHGSASSSLVIVHVLDYSPLSTVVSEGTRWLVPKQA
jgi:hypothetical protein